MVKTSRFIGILFLLLQFSCEKQRFLNVPFAEEQVVVNGFIEENGKSHIEITRSISLNDTSDIKDIINAQVQLFENDVPISELQYILPSGSGLLGFYSSSFTSFSKQKKYSIQVKIPGKETLITAVDTLPESTAQIVEFTCPTITDSLNQQLDFEINIEQSNENREYYHIQLQQRWVQYSINQIGDTTYTNYPWTYRNITPQNDPVDFIASSSEPFSLRFRGPLRGILLDNGNFVSNRKKVLFSASNPSIIGTNTFLESRVILRTVSWNYFQYYFSSSQYNRTRGVPLSEPVIIHNNISNGLGNFAAYSSDSSARKATYY